MLENAAFVFTCIAMCITSLCVVIATSWWIDEKMYARRYYKTLMMEIFEASGKLEEIYGDGKIPNDLIFDILTRLRNREFINWSQVRIDKEDSETV